MRKRTWFVFWGRLLPAVSCRLWRGPLGFRSRCCQIASWVALSESFPPSLVPGYQRTESLLRHDTLYSSLFKMESTQISVNYSSVPGGGKEDFLSGSLGKESTTMQETQEMRVQFLSQEDPLEKEMATPSSILAWEIPWTEEPRGLQSTESPRVGHDWVTKCTRVGRAKYGWNSEMSGNSHFPDSWIHRTLFHANFSLSSILFNLHSEIQKLVLRCIRCERTAFGTKTFLSWIMIPFMTSDENQ